MTANLFGARFLGHREPGWHGLGDVFQEPIGAKEAIARSRAGEIVVEKRPLQVDLGGVWAKVEPVAIVRNPTPDDPQYRILGTCSDGYQILQNAEIGELLEPLSQKWPVETVGVLGYGETLFLTLDAGSREIRARPFAEGDEIRQFFLVADTKDGQTGLRMMFTPIRVVCQNTLLAGEAAAIATANFRHTKNLREEFGWRLDILKAMESVAEKVLSSFELLAACEISAEDAKDVVEASYPYPRKPRKIELADQLPEEEKRKVAGLLTKVDEAERSWVVARQRQDERRGAALELYRKFNDEQPGLAETAWAVYNAVVELEDFREAGGNEDPLVAQLFGLRARTKERAYAEALTLAQGEELARAFDRDV